jgi:CBS domain-containing membrane protein
MCSSATPRTTLEQAWKMLASHHLKTLPVLDNGRLVGIVSLSDLVGPAMARGRFSWRGCSAATRCAWSR